MGKVYTKDDVAPSLVNGKLIELTDEQKQAKVDEWNAYEAKSGERKLKKIRELRPISLDQSILDFLYYNFVVIVFFGSKTPNLHHRSVDKEFLLTRLGNMVQGS